VRYSGRQPNWQPRHGFQTAANSSYLVRHSGRQPHWLLLPHTHCLSGCHAHIVHTSSLCLPHFVLVPFPSLLPPSLTCVWVCVFVCVCARALSRSLFRFLSLSWRDRPGMQKRMRPTMLRIPHVIHMLSGIYPRTLPHSHIRTTSVPPFSRYPHTNTPTHSNTRGKRAGLGKHANRDTCTPANAHSHLHAHTCTHNMHAQHAGSSRTYAYSPGRERAHTRKQARTHAACAHTHNAHTHTHTHTHNTQASSHARSVRTHT
jgi:hypothetical protein